jgi:hypothetical protein
MSCPHTVKHQVGLHELIVLPSKVVKMKYDIKLTAMSPSTSILEIGLSSM